MAPRSPKDSPKPAAKGKAAAQPRASARPTKAVAKPDATKAAAEAVPMLRLKDLVDGVAASTGAKKPEVKKTIEATLAALAAALGAGTVLALPPLGKLRVVKSTATALTLKLRRVSPASTGALALADKEQDS